MFEHTLRKICVLVTILCLTASMMAADVESALVTGNAHMKVNGRATAGTVTLMPGDSLENLGNVNARITNAGLSIEVAPHTAMAYAPQQLVLKSGAIAVTSQKKIKATYNGVSVETSEGNARFVIAETDKQRVIAAVRSSLTVTDGAVTVELAEGSAFVQDRTPEPGVKGKGVGKNGDSDEQRGGKLVRSKSLPGWVEVAIIGGVAGGILGGFAAAGAFSEDKPVMSPALP